jgi:methylated-DNA-[protein]-cysteine S-methyltransferase
MSAGASGYCLFDTAVGACGISWNARGITHLQIADKDRAATERLIRARSGAEAATPPQHVADVIERVRRYLEGERIDFSDVAVDIENVGDFRRRLYEALRTISWGKTTTYGGLGKMIGGQAADAREIGQAMGKNPVPIIIPCHRVLAAGNKIGGFSAPGGISTKEKLLALEGVFAGVPDDEPVFPGLFAAR